MWDPDKYLSFAEERGRPFFELLGRIRVEAPRRVVDLGCGPGNLTVTLADRWPDAVLEASDSSPEMVEAARAAGVDAQQLDVRDWKPSADTDVVISNAVLQWVPGHDVLLRRWVAELAAGAVLAFQVPGNHDAPSHRTIRALADSPKWTERLGGVLRKENPVLDPTGYADLLADAGCLVDAWETTYVQRMTGADPVLEWLTGTGLAPVKAALDDAEWAEFRAEIAPMLHEVYPARADGVTWFPFRRVFVVARVQ